MSGLPAYGTALIKCAKRKCGWTGKETDLARKPHPTSKIASQSICPKCGCDGYYFVKERPEAMTPTEQLLRDALERIKLNAVSLADAQVIALEALAAASQQAEEEPVGVAGTMPGSSGFTMAVFCAEDVPVGTNIYAAPLPAQQEAAGASFMVELDALLKKEEAFMGLVSALSIREIMERHAATLPSPAPQAAVPSEREAELRMLQAYPALAQFFGTHAIGSLTETSCFKCGKIGERAITHLKLPDIYICKDCASPSAAQGGRNVSNRHGEYLYLIWDSDDHPEYIRGHVTPEEAKTILGRELGEMQIGGIEHVYMRSVFPGDSCPDGCDREYREYAESSRGAFKVTRIDRPTVSPSSQESAQSIKEE